MIHSAMTLSNVASTGNMICSAALCDIALMDEPDLDTPSGRLTWAREHIGKYRNAADFAALAKVKPVTYRAYESGQNGYAKHAAKFARLLGVPAEWLLEGGPLPDEDARPINDIEMRPRAHGALPPETLARLLENLAPLWPTGHVSDQSLRALAEALSYGLELLSDQPANPATPGEIRLAARAAMTRSPDQA